MLHSMRHDPRVIAGDKTSGHIGRFATPAPDFELSEIRLQKDDKVSILSRSVEIFIVLEGGRCWWKRGRTIPLAGVVVSPFSHSITVS